MILELGATESVQDFTFFTFFFFFSPQKILRKHSFQKLWNTLFMEDFLFLFLYRESVDWLSFVKCICTWTEVINSIIIVSCG